MVRIAALIVATSLLAAPPAAAQSPPYPTERRPHSELIVRDRDGVAVRQLQASVRRTGRRLRVQVSLAAHLRKGGTRRAILRVGACTRGAVSFLVCPPARSRRVTLPPGAARTVALAVTTRVPSRRYDAIRVTLEHPQRRRPEYAALELHGEAWRGVSAGRRYGAEITSAGGVDVRELRFDAVGISATVVRPTMRWRAVATAPATVTWQCTVPGCTPRDVVLAPGVEGGVQRRPALSRAGATVGLTGTVAGAPLFTALLPRPVR